MTSRDREQVFHDLVVAALSDGDEIPAPARAVLDKLGGRLGLAPATMERVLSDASLDSDRRLLLPPEIGARFGFFEDALAVLSAHRALSADKRAFLENLRDRLKIAPAYFDRALANHFPEWRQTTFTRRKAGFLTKRARLGIAAAVVVVALAAVVGVALRLMDPFRRAVSAMHSGAALAPEQLSALSLDPARAFEELRSGLDRDAGGAAYPEAAAFLLEARPELAAPALQALASPHPGFPDRCLQTALDRGRMGALAAFAKADAAAFEGWARRNAEAAARALAARPHGAEEIADWGGAGAALTAPLARELLRQGRPDALAPLAKSQRAALRPVLLKEASAIVQATGPGMVGALRSVWTEYADDREAAAALLAALGPATATKVPAAALLETAHAAGADVEGHLRAWPAEALLKRFGAEDAEPAAGAKPAPWQELLKRRRIVASGLQEAAAGRWIAVTPALAAAASKEQDFAAGELLALAKARPELAVVAAGSACRLLERRHVLPLLERALRGNPETAVADLLGSLFADAPPWLVALLLEENPLQTRAWIRAQWTGLLAAAAGRDDPAGLAQALRTLGREIGPGPVAARALEICPPPLQVPVLRWARSEAPERFDAAVRSLTPEWLAAQSDASLKDLADLLEGHPRAAERVAALLQERVVRREIEELARQARGFNRLPQATRRGGEVRQGITRLQIDNDTGATLTLLFDGPEVFRLRMDAGAKQEAEMRSGTFTIYGSVDTPNVNPLRDSHALSGDYHFNLYIRRPGQTTLPRTCSSQHTPVRRAAERP